MKLFYFIDVFIEFARIDVCQWQILTAL